MTRVKRATVTEAMARRLLRKHLTGDFGAGSWATIAALINLGLVEEVDKNLRVTAAGRAWCDENHLRYSTCTSSSSSSPSKRLAAHGIATMDDLDRWIAAHPITVAKGPHKGCRELMSRYQALKKIVGESIADEMLNNLAIKQCF